MGNWDTEYQDGYRAGFLDAKNGVCLTVALTAYWRTYSRGYVKGQADAKAGKEIPESWPTSEFTPD